MTILFADLRGFTNASESLGAEKAFVLLNEYLQVMEPGSLGASQFSSANIKATASSPCFTAAPTAPSPHDRYVPGFRRSQQNPAARDEATLCIGIGINSGELMLGAIGGEQRLNGNVVGDAVNLASRASRA